MRYVFVMLWVGMSWLCAAQQQALNKIYDFGYYRNQLHRIIVHHDTIIGYGRAYANDSPNLQCLFVARFDSNGVVLDHNLICDSLGGHLTMAINWSKIIATSDHGYALTAAPFSRNAGMMVKLRNDLSVEFVREYANTTGLVDFYNAVIELPDGYLLGGYVQTPNYLLRPFLRRVDKQGETVWLSFYGEYGVTDLFSYIHFVTDSLVVCAGGYVTSENSLSGRGPWMAFINPLDGDVVQEWRPNGSDTEFLHHVFPLSEGKWLLYGKKALQVNPLRARPFWAIADSAFNILDMRLFGPSANVSNFLWDFSPTPDGHFIAAGQVNAVDPNNEPAQVYGWLYKVSPELDSLWSLRLIPPVAGSPGGYFGGVGVLSSGNMVAGGYAPLGNAVYGWLVKFTPDGCVDTLWCGTVSDWEAQETQLREPPAAVYPNPTTGQFFVSLPEGSGPVRLALHRSDGRLVLEQQITAATTVDASHLPPGIYFCRITNTAAVLLVTKLVVSR